MKYIYIINIRITTIPVILIFQKLRCRRIVTIFVIVPVSTFMLPMYQRIINTLGLRLHWGRRSTMGRPLYSLAKTSTRRLKTQSKQQCRLVVRRNMRDIWGYQIWWGVTNELVLQKSSSESRES